MNKRFVFIVFFVACLIACLWVGRGYFNDRYYNVLSSLASSIDVQNKLADWSRKNIPDKLSLDDGRFLIGGYLDGKFMGEFNWGVLGFDPDTSSVRIITDLNSGKIVALYFSENRPFRKLGLIYVIDRELLERRRSIFVKYKTEHMGVWGE